MRARAVPFPVLLLLTLSAVPAAAQAPAGAGASPPVLGAVRITGQAPTLDGRLDDEAWAAAPVAGGFVQRRPNAGAPATRPSEVRILYTEGALYIGARLTDNPDSIAAQLARRDISGIYSDWLFVMLDSDDDNRSAYVFGVNPREVQRDYIVGEDGLTDPKWDAVWEVKAAVDSAGWTAEFRIPLSQLRFSPNRSSWGLNFERIIARKEEDAFWAPIPPNSSGYVSRFGTLRDLAALSSPTRLELRPYAMSRVTRAPGDRANPFYEHNEPSGKAGLDLRYSLTSNFTLTGTVNPDFGQVEADPSEVNLTAFETSLAEQRPFFLEDSRIFEFNMGGSAGDLLYTRRIGARPRGTVPTDAEFADVPDGTTILGAVKLSGKTSSGWTVGVLNALTAEERGRYTVSAGQTEYVPVEPLTNFSAARVIRDFNGGSSALGGIVTLVNRRLDDTGLDFLRSTALTGGIDGRHRFGAGKNYEVNGFMAGSWIEGSELAIRNVQLGSAHYFQRPDASYLEVDSTATTLSGMIANLEVAKLGGGHWSWELGVRARSPGLEINDFGFQNQTDRMEEYGALTYSEPRPGRHFRSWSAVAAHLSHWTFGRERVRTMANLNASAQLRNFWNGSVTVERELSALSVSELRGGPALVIPGRTTFRASLSGDRRRRVVWGAGVAAAVQDQTDSRSMAFSTALDIRPSPRMLVSLAPSLTLNDVTAQYIGRANGADGTPHYFFAGLDQTTAALTARVSYTLSPKLSLQLYAQPFLSAGDYSDPLEVDDPRADAFEDRFLPASLTVLPDFNVKQFRSNAVLRWEYRPGSTVFVVWNSALDHRGQDGAFNLFDDTRTLFGAEGTNTLLVKFSYWFGL